MKANNPFPNDFDRIVVPGFKIHFVVAIFVIGNDEATRDFGIFQHEDIIVAMIINDGQKAKVAQFLM